MWKDARHGRVLLCDAELGEQLAGILATPLRRVAKQNPDRTISTEGRFVNDQRESNELSSKYDHPPAPQPRHRGLARLILWWKVNYPGRKIFLAKRDVDSAFKLLWVAPEDACVFTTELPGSTIGLDHMVLVIYLSLTFGWVGSPGNYGAFSALRVQ